MIVAVAVFVALFGNVAFFATAIRTFGATADGLMFAASLFFHITAIFVLVLSAVCHRAMVKPILILFLMLSAVIACYSNMYGTIFDHRMIANIFETDMAEASDLISPQLALYVLVLGVLPSLAIYCAPLEHPHWMKETAARLKLAGGAGIALALAYFAFSGHYASMMREHRELVDKINPTFALYSAVKLAVRSMPSGTRQHLVVGADAKTPADDGHRELVIMVVGETVRADHWSLNGYARETTPLLKRAGVLNFPDFWSCDTSTARSVPCMFSNLGRAKFDVEQAKANDNALDVLKRAGVSVLWRDNNSSSKGVADRVTSEDFKSPAKNPVCDEEECRDEGMLHGLQEYVDAQPGDVLIVLHQMGNHGPAYYKRYPKRFEQFTPVCRTNDLGSCSPEEIANAYDNAILYTDYVLSEVVELLKRNDGRFETAMMYVSDHGESLGEYGLYLHAAPYALAPEAQRHVPAVMWLGDSMRHDLRLDAMEERRKRRLSHDNVFATLLGLFEVRSTAYDPRLDLLEHADRVPSVAH
ncbi:MAG: phosphoethanolamine transferase [Hyphomicrobium sp.]